MCNANNHPPDCTCGFGGDGHLGRSSGIGLSTIFAPVKNIQPTGDSRNTVRLLRKLDINRLKYDSYVNPNAICPVCGAEVFFYQSPYGGRVYFDEMTPPWPKHPCTDNGQIPERNKKPNNLKPKWTEGDWSPIDTFIPTLAEGKYLIRGYIIKENKSEFIEDYLIDQDSDFENSDLKVYRDIDEERFEIIYLNLKNDKIGRIIGHKRSSAIRLGFGRHISIKIGEELIVEFRGVDLGLKIQVTPIDRPTTLKCFIDKRDISDETRKNLRVVPYKKFTFKVKVISKEKEIIMKEV